MEPSTTIVFAVVTEVNVAVVLVPLAAIVL